ncbi:MAG: M28 family peptidase [Bryobacteraceae bacterium]
MTRPEAAAALAGFFAALAWAGQPVRTPNAVSGPLAAVLNSITADELKGDLSFLASDALEGRYTPSPGLDVAAEFIASRFRAAGLEPGGDQDYFQTAAMVDRQMPKAQSDMTVQDGQETFTVPAQSIAISNLSQAARIDHALVVIFSARDPDLIKSADLSGKAVVVPQTNLRKLPRDQGMALYEKRVAFDTAIASSKAAVEIAVSQEMQPSVRPRLISSQDAQAYRVPLVVVTGEELKKWRPGSTVSLDLPAPEDRKLTLKNVVGILRGSDPNLKDTCVLLTAHYDHIGTTETGAGMAMNRTKNPNDHIYNGANDDGSGTVSVIEIARALARLNPHPKRSLVFMTFFGEERGEIGSEYYGKHPIFPIAKTIADVNLEQVGRTDSTEGRQVNNASLTGFDYSDVTKFMEEAGRETGIKIYKDKEASDAYFTMSDNASLAEQGVPAHSLTVAFDYPDYHGLGDEWQKIDYDNMAKIDRMVALSLIEIANSARPPEWNAQNPKTLPFREAQQKSHQR